MGAGGRKRALIVNCYFDETRLPIARTRKIPQAMAPVWLAGAFPAERCVYHHLTEPSGINASLLRSLRPGGVLAVVDFPPPFFFSRGSFGVAAKTVIGEVTGSGFTLVRLIDDWPGRGPLGSYCVVFRKP